MATLATGTTIGGAAPVTVPSNGTSGQLLISDGDGTYSWSAAGIDWSAIANKPTALSQFTNNLGNYGNFITACSNTVSSNGKTYRFTKNYASASLSNSNCNCVCDCRD